MPLQLLPMEESDLYAYQSIFAEAFGGGLMALMYPNGYTEEAKQIGIDFQRKEWFRHTDRVYLMKVIDTELPSNGTFGQIVGVSKWKFYPRDRTDGELQEEANEDAERPLPPGCNEQLMKEFFGAIGKCKKEILGGQAYACLSVLATLPHHHRRGIGSMHLSWGLAKADELGLQAYLEASPDGKPLYEKFGFEGVRMLPFDARAWGLDRDLPHVCMLRPSRNSNGKAM